MTTPHHPVHPHHHIGAAQPAQGAGPAADAGCMNCADGEPDGFDDAAENAAFSEPPANPAA